MAGEKNIGRIIRIVLLIIGLLLFAPLSLYSLLFLVSGFGGYWGFFGLIPMVITLILILSLVNLFRKEENKIYKKTYKSDKTLSKMKIQYLFYIVGVIFIFSSVWYFAREYIAQFPKIIKLILLIVSIIVSYVVAEFLRRSDI